MDKAPLERTLYTVQNPGVGRAIGRWRLGTNIKFQQNSTVVQLMSRTVLEKRDASLTLTKGVAAPIA